MARRGTDDLPASARRPLPGAPHRPAAAHPEAVRWHAASRPRPVAGRARDRVLQREEFLLRGPLPRRRGDGSGQAAAREVDVELELREPPLHQLGRLVLARRALLRHRREASRPRRPRDSRREEGRRGPPHPRAAAPPPAAPPPAAPPPPPPPPP